MAAIGNGNYYAVIPAEVRYDPDINASAKLLYGELTSLCNQTGYCWAGNAYFAELYGLSVRTISRLISQLEEKGYIRCEMAATKDGSERHIYAGLFVVTPEGGRQKCPGGIDENVQPPLDKNVYQNNKQENNKQNIPPVAPQGAAGRRSKSNKYALQEDAKPLLRDYVGTDRELHQALADFILIRQELRAINSRRAIAMLLKELDDLSGGDRETKLQLIRQSCTNSWKSVFPLKGPRASPPGSTGWAPDPEVY